MMKNQWNETRKQNASLALFLANTVIPKLGQDAFSFSKLVCRRLSGMALNRLFGEVVVTPSFVGTVPGS